MRVVELVQPVTDAQIGDVALVMRDNLPAMVDLQEAINDFTAGPLSEINTRLVDLESADVVTPQMFGAVGDDLTDDTFALQAAINACKALGTVDGSGGKLLYIPPGTYRHTGLVVDRPITIKGAEGRRTRLRKLPGGTSPSVLISPAHDGFDYVSATSLFANIRISGIHLIGAGKEDVGAADGWRIQNASVNPIYTLVVLDDISAWAHAGNGLKGNTFAGPVNLSHFEFMNNKLCGADINSCVDWRIDVGECGSNELDSLLIAGCVQMRLFGTYVYSGGRFSASLFNSQTMWHGCTIDASGTHGLNYDCRREFDYNKFIDTDFRKHGFNTTPDTYADIYVSSLSTSELYLQNCGFEYPNNGSALYNIQFQGSGNYVYEAGCRFEGGDVNAANVTNAPLQLRSVGRHLYSKGDRNFATLPMEVVSSVQYTGQRWGNGSTSFAAIYGSTPTNTTGVLDLYEADGVTVGQRLTAPGSGIRSQIQPPGPYVDDADAIANGVLPNRQYRQTGGGVAYVGGGASGGSINANTVYASRSAAAVATIPPTQNSLRLYHLGVLLEYKREAGAISNPALTTNGGAVYWSPADEVTVFHWGPAADGAIDDTAIVQSAVDYAAAMPSRSRRPVFANPGYYRITHVNVPAHVTLYGAGDAQYSQTCFLHVDLTQSAFALGNRSVLRDLFIQVDNTNRVSPIVSPPTIEVIGSSYPRIERIRAQDAYILIASSAACIINDIYGFVHHRMVYLKDTLDVSYITNLHSQNPDGVAWDPTWYAYTNKVLVEGENHDGILGGVWFSYAGRALFKLSGGGNLFTSVTGFGAERIVHGIEVDCEGVTTNQHDVVFTSGYLQTNNDAIGQKLLYIRCDSGRFVFNGVLLTQSAGRSNEDTVEYLDMGGNCSVVIDNCDFFGASYTKAIAKSGGNLVVTGGTKFHGNFLSVWDWASGEGGVTIDKSVQFDLTDNPRFNVGLLKDLANSDIEIGGTAKSLFDGQRGAVERYVEDRNVSYYLKTAFSVFAKLLNPKIILHGRSSDTDARMGGAGVEGTITTSTAAAFEQVLSLFGYKVGSTTEPATVNYRGDLRARTLELFGAITRAGSGFSIIGSNGGRIEGQTSAADASGNVIFMASGVDKDSIAPDKRRAIIAMRLAGTTANKRGGAIDISTAADNSDVHAVRVTIDENGNVILRALRQFADDAAAAAASPPVPVQGIYINSATKALQIRLA